MAVEVGRSIADVFKDIVGNVQQIIRAEVRLAKTEVRDELLKMKRGVTIIAAGGVIGILAIGVLLLAAVYALSLVLPPWAAALIVAVVTAAIAGVCVMTGIKQLKRVTLPPAKTVATVQENIQWAKTRAK
jgi:apolipoprotein N-acyltransferase